MARAYVTGDLDVDGVAPRRPLRRAGAAAGASCSFRRPTPAELVALRARRSGLDHLKPPPPPPQEHLPRWRRVVEGAAALDARDAEAIHHHYDVSNRVLRAGARAVDDLHLRGLPDRRRRRSRRRRPTKYDLVARKLDLQPGQRLLDVGCGWGGMVRHAAKEYGVKALGVTLSREQAAWAQEAIKRGGARRPRRGPAPRLPRTSRSPASTRSARSASPSTSGCATTRRTSASSATSCARGPAAQPLHHPRRTTSRQRDRRVHRPLRLPRRRADRLRPDHHRGRRTPASRCSTRRTSGVHYALTLAGWCRNLAGQLGRLRRRGRRGHRPGVGPLHGRLAARLRAQRDPAPPGARRPGPTAHDGSTRRAGYGRCGTSTFVDRS